MKVSARPSRCARSLSSRPTSISLRAGGTVVNTASALITGGYDGVRISAGSAGAGALVANTGAGKLRWLARSLALPPSPAAK